MAGVTFSTTVGGDGSTVTDDADPTTGLDGGGHRTRFVPALAQIVAVATFVINAANAINAIARGEYLGIDTQASSFTLALVNKGRLQKSTSASANTVTFPPNSAVAFPVNSRVDGVQYGAGQATLTAGVGVTLRSEGGLLKTKQQYSMWSATKIGTDEWLIAGSLSA